MEVKENCLSCGKETSNRVSQYSRERYNKVLCMDCQKELQPKQNVQTTQPTTTQSKINENISDEHIIMLQGKKFITHAGLLELAHKVGLERIETELIDVERNIVKATVTMKNNKVFTGHGDANTSNVNDMVAPHMFRMAETRAVNRALRFATNTGLCSIEELGGNDGD